MGPTVLDLDSLTWDELDELEERTGFVMESHTGAVPRPVLKTIAWILLRRDNLDLTFADMGRMQVRDSIAIEAPGSPKGNGTKRTPASRSRSASR